MSNGDKTVKNKNILKFARQRKKSGRINMDDIKAAEAALPKLSPGEKKARFGESDEYQDMVAKKLKIGLGGLLGTAPNRILQRAIRKMPPPEAPGRRSNKKPVLDSSGKPVKNLTQDMADGGEVFDLTTEMVIDE